MSNLREELIAKGLASPEQAEAGEEKNDQPQTAGQDVELTQADIETGALLIEILGKKRAVQVLDAEMPLQRGYGYGRAQGTLQLAVSKVLDHKPQREAQPLRSRFENCSLMSYSRARDFNDAISGVFAAVTTGASEAWMAEQKRLEKEVAAIQYPQPPEWPSNASEYQHQDAINAYIGILNEWSLDYSAAQLKTMGFDAYRIAREWSEAQKKAEVEAKAKCMEEVVAEFDRTGDFSTLNQVIVTEKLGDSYTAGYVAKKHPRYAWPCAVAGHIKIEDVEVAPPADWLAAQTDEKLLIRCAREAYYRYAGKKYDYRPVFREQLLLAMPLTPDEHHVVVSDRLAIDKEGYIYSLTVKSSAAYPDPNNLPGQRVANTPHPDGWVTIRAANEYGQTKVYATLYGPEHYRALETALRCKRGTFDPRAWLSDFARHPEKGFGRFFFQRRSDRVMISVDDRLRERLELLAYLPDRDDVSYPDNIWYLPARLSSKKPNGGHLVWDESSDRGFIAWKGEAHWQQLSRRSIGDYISHRESGTAAAWSMSASSARNTWTQVVALIGEGEELHLDSGMAYRYEDGELKKIPGGALREDEKSA